MTTTTTTPAYVVKKVGDSFQIMPKDAPVEKAGGLVMFVAGALVAYYGSSRGGLKGLLLTAAGGYAACWSARNSCLFCGRTAGREVRRGSGRGPSWQHEYDAKGRVAQAPKDEVEEASMESFPASDPPARMAHSGPPEGDE